MRFIDRTIVVTGGGSGIGKAICLKLAGEGANLVILDRAVTPREGGTPTRELLPAAVFIEGDVARWADVEGAVATAVERFGRIDVMVNNAAIGTGQSLLETSEEDWDRVMAVNAKGVFLGCKAAIARMVGQEPRVNPLGDAVRGRIVNISSQHGMIASPGDLAYGVGKAAVVYMTRQIAHDHARHGIVCNAVAPGKILTGKTGRAVEPDILAYSHARTPWPRLGRPEDVAAAVAFLASDEATYITGENLMVDGGWMAS